MLNETKVVEQIQEEGKQENKNSFKEIVDYRDFVLSISELLKQGKLINKAGYYFVQSAVYEEF